MKLIDKDRLISILNAKADIALGEPKKYFAHVAQMVEPLPKVDAVEVVRCKDCKYYAPLITGEEICFCDLREMTTYDDDFCSRGKRRKKDDD